MRTLVAASAALSSILFVACNLIVAAPVPGGDEGPDATADGSARGDAGSADATLSDGAERARWERDWSA